MKSAYYTTEYWQYENLGYNRKCIDGSVVVSKKCVGYCECDLHPGFLTEKHKKHHQCVKKECFYFKKKEAAPKSEFQRKLLALAI